MDVSKLKVEELKAELKSRGLDVKGKKAELADRLSAALTATATESSETAGEAEGVVGDAVENRHSDGAAVVHESQEPQSQEVNDGSSVTINDDVTAEVISNSETAPPQVSEETASVEAHVSSTESGLLPATLNPPLISEQDVAPQPVPQPEPEAVQSTHEDPAVRSEDVSLEAEATRHLRVDHFSRPCNPPALSRWLTDLLARPISPADWWMNAIKTHMYISFSSPTEASRARRLLEGQTFPAHNPARLEASFTTVAAAEAEQSAEAKLPPSEWRRIPFITAPVVQAASAPVPVKVVQTIKTQQGALRVVQLKPLAPASALARTSSDLFRQALAGAVGRKEERPALSTVEGVDSGFVTSRYKRKAGEGPHEEDVTAKRGHVEEEQSWRRPTVPHPALDLERLFRKTTTTPVLYWLPVSEEEVARRRKYIIQTRPPTTTSSASIAAVADG